MKCPKCGGTAYAYACEDENGKMPIKCPWCGYSEVQTNEEWLRQATTEQLADVLWEKINGAFNSGYACCNLKQDKDYVGRYKRFKEWLKQLHGGEA